MKICRGCSRSIPDSRFCPECGRDQTVLFPTEDTISTDSAIVRRERPPSPPRIIDATLHSTYQPPPQDAAASSATPNWLKGMAYSFGGCVFLVLMSIFGMITFAVIVASCMAAGDPGGTPP